MRPIRFIIACMTFVLMFVVGITSSVLAEGNFEAKNGFYVGLALHHNSIDGDFDGDTILVTSEDVSLVPEIDSAVGLGFLVGGRFDQVAMEISYIKSDHDAHFLGAEGDAEFRLVSFDGKWFFMTDRRVQPYLQGGFTLDWIEVEDASATFNLVVDNAEFFGVGLNAGGGVAFYLNPRVALTAGITYRLITYLTVEGAAGDASLEDNLSGSGLNFNTGLTFTF